MVCRDENTDMSKLQDVDASALLEAFHNSSDGKSVRRLAMAIAYLDGVPVDTLADRYGIPRSTIYAWLDRFEEESIEAAVRDGSRPGRPPELEPHEFVQLSSDIADGPEAHGFTESRWTASRLQTHISDAYGVEYSTGHARRLLRQLSEKSGN